MKCYNRLESLGSVVGCRGDEILEKHVTIAELMAEFELERLDTEGDISRRVTVTDINRPGLALAGFFTYHPSERLQILGRSEIGFFSGMAEELQRKRAGILCSYEQTPCIILSRGLEPPATIVDASNASRLPLMRTSEATTKFITRLTQYFDHRLAPETLVHGVLVDVYGIGILITGSSGVGKSETALELVKRGHRLVADDAVEIRQVSDTLIGTTPPLLKHLLEIRGIGVLNVMTLFGAGAVRTHKKLEMVIHLEAWRDDVFYDRLGLDEHTTRILDTDLACVTVPVRPGRNLAVIIEVAAMNQRLKRMGYNAARELSEKLMQTIEEDVF